MVTKQDVQEAADLVNSGKGTNRQELSRVGAVVRQLAMALQVYKERGEFDGSLKCAIDCLKQAEFEITGATEAFAIGDKVEYEHSQGMHHPMTVVEILPNGRIRVKAVDGTIKEIPAKKLVKSIKAATASKKAWDILVDLLEETPHGKIPAGLDEYIDLVAQVYNGGLQQYVENDHIGGLGAAHRFLQRLPQEGAVLKLEQKWSTVRDVTDRYLDLYSRRIEDPDEDEEFEKKVAEAEDLITDEAIQDAALKYFQELIAPKATGAAKVTKPEDIANLPWMGNHFSDSPLFKAVDRYIAQEKDPKKQKFAIQLMVQHGMGIEEPLATDEELEEYLSEMKAYHSKTTAGGDEDEDQGMENPHLKELAKLLIDQDVTVLKNIDSMHPKDTEITFHRVEDNLLHNGLQSHLRGTSSNPAVDSDIWQIQWVVDNIELNNLSTGNAALDEKILKIAEKAWENDDVEA